MTPARGAPIPEHVWVVGSVALLFCATAAVIALFRKTVGDRIAGVAAGILTGWMIYAFYNAVS
jgi:hypothetical protein